ncbi:MAG TPA: chitin deacetylase [Rhodospirillaceae bacterium]|nr:chitin deacetylase [Rhodospirillaceae bacterium]HAA93544.1 chitin deacetylase [Rhodospirillaceae bacterium]HAT35011.1 chitin deacetylase [Rhodospirillaceae bacterium]
MAERSGATESAIGLLYHRFAESDHPATSLSVEKFSSHIKELNSGEYTVLPLADLIDKLEKQEPLPKRAVVITIDDAYVSVYKHAWPLLKKAALPVTLFLTTQPVDSGQQGYLSWEQLKEMTGAGVTIGLKAHSQARLSTQSPEAIRREIETASDLVRKNLNVTPVAFAFPYGLASRQAQRIVYAAGYKAAFGQHSGVLHRRTDRFFLPRFSFTDAYGDLKRFRTVVNAAPLPITDLTPSNPLLADADNPPNLGFTVLQNVENLSRLACYHSKFGKLKLQRLGTSRIEIRFQKAFPPGRSRINCTMLTPSARWRWFGMQYYLPAPQ